MINIHDLSVSVTPNMAIKHNVITMCVGKTTGTVYQDVKPREEAIYSVWVIIYAPRI